MPPDSHKLVHFSALVTRQCRRLARPLQVLWAAGPAEESARRVLPASWPVGSRGRQPRRQENPEASRVVSNRRRSREAQQVVTAAARTGESGQRKYLLGGPALLGMTVFQQIQSRL